MRLDDLIKSISEVDDTIDHPDNYSTREHLLRNSRNTRKTSMLVAQFYSKIETIPSIEHEIKSIRKDIKTNRAILVFIAVAIVGQLFANAFGNLNEVTRAVTPETRNAIMTTVEE